MWTQRRGRAVAVVLQQRPLSAPASSPAARLLRCAASGRCRCHCPAPEAKGLVPTMQTGSVGSNRPLLEPAEAAVITTARKSEAPAVAAAVRRSVVLEPIATMVALIAMTQAAVTRVMTTTAEAALASPTPALTRRRRDRRACILVGPFLIDGLAGCA